MTRLRSVADYERELAQLEALIEEERRYTKTADSFAAQISLSSLEQRLQRLRLEMHERGDEHMPGHELLVVFKGRPVVNHGMDAEFMGNILLEIQKLLTAMVSSGDPRFQQRGRFRSETKAISRLHFTGAFEGSFGMRLEAIQEQPELDGYFPLAPTLQALLDLLASGENSDKVLDQLVELGERTIGHYRTLVSELSSNQADIRVEWPNLSGRREATLRHTQARNLLLTLKDVRETHDGAYYIGILDQASRRKGRFGFRTDDGTMFDGVVEDHLIDELRNFYDRRCRAYVVTRTLEHLHTGVVKKAYRLQELLELSDDEEVALDELE